MLLVGVVLAPGAKKSANQKHACDPFASWTMARCHGPPLAFNARLKGYQDGVDNTTVPASARARHRRIVCASVTQVVCSEAIIPQRISVGDGRRDHGGISLGQIQDGQNVSEAMGGGMEVGRLGPRRSYVAPAPWTADTCTGKRRMSWTNTRDSWGRSVRHAAR